MTASTLGTVRTFFSQEDFRLYIQKVNRTNQLGSKTRFEHFHFQPTQLFAVDRKGRRVIERTYLAPSVSDILRDELSDSRYGKKFDNGMRENKVNSAELKMNLIKAVIELKERVWKQTHYDSHQTNLLVLDYDPKTKKPTIAIVDHQMEGKS